MGFKERKKQVLDCLQQGHVLHQQRSHIDIKNLLAVGDISLDEVAAIIGRSRGGSYSTSPHHLDDRVDVHVISTRHKGQSWYIKWYFVEPNSVFISVHH